MYIIIIGCGRTGSRLANMLSDEDHNVVVIDENKNSFSRLASNFNGITIVGNGIDEDVLKQAGADKADALLAMKDDDNSNIMASQIADNFFNVDRIITKINNQNREYLYRNFRMETINTVEIGAFAVRNALLQESIQRFIIDEENEVEIITLKVGEERAEQSPVELDIHNGQTKVLAVIREGKVCQIDEVESLNSEDKLILALENTEYADYLERIKGGATK